MGNWGGSRNETWGTMDWNYVPFGLSVERSDAVFIREKCA